MSSVQVQQRRPRLIGTPSGRIHLRPLDFKRRSKTSTMKASLAPSFKQRSPPSLRRRGLTSSCPSHSATSRHTGGTQPTSWPSSRFALPVVCLLASRSTRPVIRSRVPRTNSLYVVFCITQLKFLINLIGDLLGLSALCPSLAAASDDVHRHSVRL
jgi:hypothetical protein